MLLLALMGCEKEKVEAVIKNKGSIRSTYGYIKEDGKAYEGKANEEEGIVELTNVLLEGIVDLIGNSYGKDFWEFKNGMLDGKCVEYEHEKGKDFEWAIYNFKEGKLEGKSIEYWGPEKDIKKEINIKNGVGTVKEYYKSGKLKAEGEIKNHMLGGEEKVYYEDGSIKEINNYMDGKLEGERETYYQSGKKRFEGIYKDGDMVEGTGWFGNNQVAMEKKDGIISFYDYKGHMYRQNDFNEMVMKFYRKNGELEKVEAYEMVSWNTQPRKFSEGLRIVAYYKYYNDLGLENMMFYNSGTRLITDNPQNPELKKKLKVYKFNQTEYDELGLKIYENDGVSKYEYDELGRLILSGTWDDDFETYNYKTIYEYEEGERKETTKYYSYLKEDNYEATVGKLTTAGDIYDENGNLIVETYQGNEFKWYSYDERNNLLRANYTYTKFTDYEYDDKNRMTHEYYIELPYKDINFDEKGRLINYYEYDEKGRVSRHISDKYKLGRYIKGDREFEYDGDSYRIKKHIYHTEASKSASGREGYVVDGEVKHVYFKLDKINPFRQIEGYTHTISEYMKEKKSLKKELKEGR